MMGDKKFKDRVVGVCKEELRPLVQELRGLFFKRSESSYIYNHTIVPQDYLDACKRHLKALKPLSKKSGSKRKKRAEGGPARKRSKDEVV